MEIEFVAAGAAVPAKAALARIVFEGATHEGAIGQAVAALDPQRLWVNPDCGLKTRSWPEVEASLSSITAAVQRARTRVDVARRAGDADR